MHKPCNFVFSLLWLSDGLHPPNCVSFSFGFDLFASQCFDSGPTIQHVFLIISSLTGPVNVRHNPAPETPGNSIGLEAIIRKALMGSYDQSEERSPSSAANPLSSSLSAEGRVDDSLPQGANT